MAETNWRSMESSSEFAISRLASDMVRALRLSAALLYFPTCSTSSSMPSFPHSPPRNRYSAASPTSGMCVAGAR